MEFTVELRYQSGSQTVVSIDAESADAALAAVRDPGRVLVGVHITAPSERRNDAERPSEPRGATPPPFRRTPVQHRRSRRQG